MKKCKHRGYYMVKEKEGVVTYVKIIATYYVMDRSLSIVTSGEHAAYQMILTNYFRLENMEVINKPKITEEKRVPSRIINMYYHRELSMSEIAILSDKLERIEKNEFINRINTNLDSCYSPFDKTVLLRILDDEKM